MVGTATLLPISEIWASTEKQRKFRLCLNPGIIGVKADQKEALRMADQYGYEAIISMPKQLMQWSEKELNAFNKERLKKNISWGSTNLPIEFRKDEETFKKGLADLPKYAEVLQKAGSTRMNTWILPMHPNLSYTPNMKQHADRLGQCARILDDYEITLGLEYVSQKTTIATQRFPFIRTMSETAELIENINSPNVGYVLDAIHWYCAEDTADDIKKLRPEQIVTVDLNDGKAGLTRDTLLNLERELPLATGIIDLKPFVQALVDIGYDGPVRTEPFNKALNEMDDEKALEVNMKSLQKVLSLLK